MTPADCIVIIPARMGSKRIPNKNFAPIHPDGRSPLQLAVDCALHAGARNIIVTSDLVTPPGILPVIWHTRPPALAQDETPMFPVIEDILWSYPRIFGSSRSAILLIQPTQPLRQTRHLRRAAKLLTPSVDSVVSIGLDRFQRDGTVYAFWNSTVERFGTIYGEEIVFMPVPAAETCNLNIPEDWAEAERRLRTS